MLNNPVLDVSIGLIFIYLLYSLLATTIKELIATLFSYRGRMLERGLEQMLDGKNYSYYWWDKLYHVFAVLRMEKPTIVKAAGEIVTELERTDGETEPANSSATKLNSTEQEDIKPTFHERALQNCATSANPKIKGSKLCKKQGLFAANVTRHPLYVRSSERTLFSKKPAYLASDTFSDILIDLLSPQLDRPVLLSDIASVIKNMEGGKQTGTAKILSIYINQANGDLQRFKLLIEGWYDDTMNRVTGWYKKQAFSILLIIGMVLAVSFNVSTIAIVQKLSTDKQVRDAMVKSASEYIKDHPNGINSATANQPTPKSADAANTKKDSVAKKAAVADTTAGKDKAVKNKDVNKNMPGGNTANSSAASGAQDSKQNVPKAADTSFNKLKDGVANIQKLYNESIEPQNVSLGLGWGDFGLSLKQADWEKFAQPLRDSIKAAIKQHNWAKDKAFRAQLYERPRPTQRSTAGKILFVIWKTLSVPNNLLGFLLTALAISLGAPFWFDLLNKFISLRVSGNKPEDDKTSSKTAKLNQKPDPKSFA